jgi:uncharacterized protein (TIGR02453 family)
MQISKDNFAFLSALKAHNDRDWFTANKKTYEKQLQNTEAFADEVLRLLNTHDVIETPSGKKSLFRIYRDVRFSSDKSPYKVHWAGGFRRAEKHRRGGYYFHIQPGGENFIAGGFWNPNKEDLQRIREEIAAYPEELRAILNAPAFVKTFGSLQGEQLKTAPKGFDKDHPAVDLLRHKQFIVHRTFSDAEALSEDFSQKVDETYRAMRPFFDYMSEVLTTDANGAPL